ncbi:Aminodeoxychorismate synthase component 1 [Fundidesulfovibrio magnetotacticus]|uniref:Aminodeoxychorismate synthase component 1 n=1 Tax=Fundidesulfovibrio magnetotacticus TaxID=2730080 RepID=A0A6V8LWH6_9BACT|nr:chorismate-binding protein [Fundidesulfovibrio magnetotacticus]GFK94628.1 Aminodeoxychorismate synthase component 1 [Fundidesulfovibrio magnetotacticus]
MTSFSSCCPADGLAWIDALAPERPDVFVTPPMPGVAASGLAGLWPVAEWRLETGGGLEGLKAFCDASAGPALGFLSYQAGFPGLGVARRPTAFPEGVFRTYGAVLAPSPDARSVTVHAATPGLRDAALRLVSGARRSPAPPLPALHAPRPSMDREAYAAAVRCAREHILDGDAYQLNLSIRFDADWPAGSDPQALFTGLLARRPAMFYGMYHDAPYTLLSTSPERFLRVRGGMVLAQPIKGTRLAGADPVAAARALRASAKEDAELSMIVDLMRNDISGRCAYGSVSVEGHRSVFLVDGLLQMYANVSGALRPDADALDLLWDALPPGSVTGCPKARAVELIADLEPHHRDAYCGCLVLRLGPRDLDSSVAIRTACHDATSGTLGFFAGSGIVVDSDPHLEYEETMAKAAKFLALARRNTP